MTDPLYGFYLAALEAELTFAPPGEFSARMAAYYCRALMALEAAPAPRALPRQPLLFGEAA